MFIQIAKTLSEDALAAINKLTIEPVTAEQVFCFTLRAADNQVDRDTEAFADSALAQMAEAYIGKTVILDHSWSAKGQVGRIYGSHVEDEGGGVKALMLDCYMLDCETTKDLISAIKAGILKEVSVGCAVTSVKCSICGAAYYECGHSKGESYGGKSCYAILDGVTDCYEVSFVAVPAQRGAGVARAQKSATAKLLPSDKTEAEQAKALAMAKAKAANLRNYAEI